MLLPQQGPSVPETANERVRRNLREIMRIRRMSQAQLADALGRSQPWLSKRLTNVTPFHLEDIDAISAIFGLTPAEFLCEGYGQFDRRKGGDRRVGQDRRQSRPLVAFNPVPKVS